MSLKTILRNFLNHFETLEERRKCPSGDEDGYAKEFQSLKELTESLKRDNFYACKHGLKDVNRRKNRYKDILPYDYSRVILSEYPGVPGSDYINANFVRGSTGSACAYVASQGPLPNTVVDFWRMIWECEVSVIVMACNETESGKYKCETYWPSVTDQEQQYGNITAQLIKWRQVCPDFLVRTFKVKSDNEERIVCQFHYTTWPDHGVPNTVGPILELVRLMRDVQASEARPILVHCSAGCGRTGTICSIDYVWALLRTGKLKEDFSLYKIIHEMRRQRIAMVQTQEQYIYCYRAVAALFEQQLKMIDAHTYENLDEDGEPYHKFTEEENIIENTSSDEESSPGISEAEIHYRVQRSATFPSKDMKQLVDSWRNKKMTAAPSTEFPSHLPDTMMFNETYGSPDNKQEKLIGKATVIRRPSIAKFKAMFGSMELAHQRQQQQRHSANHVNDNFRMETPNNYYINNYSNPFQGSDCTDSVAASDQEGDTDRESRYQVNSNHLGNHHLKKSFSYLGPEVQNCPLSILTTTTDSNNEPDSGDDIVDGSRIYESPSLVLRQHQQQKQRQQQLQHQQRPSSQQQQMRLGDDGKFGQISQHRSSKIKEELPPPKPPRTYQYSTKGNTISAMSSRALLGPMNSTNSGRIIVSVAQRVRPRIYIPDEERATLSESKSHNDLYASSTYSNIPAFSFNHKPNQYYNYRPGSNRGMENNKQNYHQQQQQIQQRQQESRNQQPIYERLKNDHLNSTTNNGRDLPPPPRTIYRPSLPQIPIPPANKIIRAGPTYMSSSSNMSESNRFGNITLRRELTSPAILMHNTHHHLNGSMQSRDQGGMYSIPPHQMTNIHNRPRPPMQIADSRNSGVKSSLPSQHHKAQPINSNNQSKSIKRPTSTTNGPPVSGPQAPTPIVSNQPDEKNLAEITNHSNEKKKITKTNSKNSNKNDSKSSKETHQASSEKKHHSFSFSSAFFPFRKTTKTKATTSLNQQSGPHSNPGNPSIRPPHSHRFSPPTQWTQV